MTIPTEVAALRKPDFGDYVRIEQKRYGVPNEIYDHKVVARLVSNAWVDVPVQSPAKESLHDECVEVVACICCGVQETDVRKYRLSDVMLVESALTAKAEAVAWEERMRPVWDERSPWTAWERCSRESYDNFASKPQPWISNDWEIQRRALYAHAPPAVPVESLGRDADAVAWCDSEDPTKVANVATGYGSFGCTIPLGYLCAPPPASVPDGFAIVPSKMYVSPEQWDAAQFAFGGPGSNAGEPFYDCTLWVGEIENDDGSKTHGLHVSCDECPEEGSITLSEFSAPPTNQQGAAP